MMQLTIIIRHSDRCTHDVPARFLSRDIFNGVCVIRRDGDGIFCYNLFAYCFNRSSA